MTPLSRVLATVLLTVLMPAVTITPVRGEGGRAPAGRYQPPVKALPLNAVPRTDGIQLRWRAIPGSEGYRVYHEQGAELKPGSFWVDIAGSQTSYLFQEATPGVDYTFRVSALYGNQERFSSAPVTARMKDKTSTGRTDTAK